jgi:hypothetical protein
MSQAPDAPESSAPADADAAAPAASSLRLPLVHFNSRGDFQAAWRAALARIAEQGCREVWFVDHDFSNWPLGERATCGLLTQWAQARRSLVLLAANFDEVQRMHPRWVMWRRQWSHLVQCRQVDPSDEASIPTMVLAPGVLSLRLRDPVHFRGRVSHDLADEVRDRDELDAFLQRSHAAFPVTTLGL